MSPVTWSARQLAVGFDQPLAGEDVGDARHRPRPRPRAARGSRDVARLRQARDRAGGACSRRSGRAPARRADPCRSPRRGARPAWRPCRPASCSRSAAASCGRRAPGRSPRSGRRATARSPAPPAPCRRASPRPSRGRRRAPAARRSGRGGSPARWRSPRRRSASSRWALSMAASPPLTATYMAQPSIVRMRVVRGRQATPSGAARTRSTPRGKRAWFCFHCSTKWRGSGARRDGVGRLDARAFAATARSPTTGCRPAGSASSNGPDIPACPARNSRARSARPGSTTSANIASDGVFASGAPVWKAR